MPVADKKLRRPAVKKDDAALRKEAQANVSVVHRVGKKEEVVKPGIPLDTSDKHDKVSEVRFGFSKGATLNMGDYQSQRIDAWVSDTLRPGESLQDGFARLNTIIDEVLENYAVEA